MSNSTFLPLLAIFNIEYVLCPFHVDYVAHPCSMKNGKLFNKDEDAIECYPQVPRIFEKLKNSGIKIAIFESCSLVDETIQLVKMIDWYQYILFTEIRSNESVDLVILSELLKKLNATVPSNKVIFFHKYKWMDFMDLYPAYSVYVHHSRGVTIEILDKGLEEFNKKMSENE